MKKIFMCFMILGISMPYLLYSQKFDVKKSQYLVSITTDKNGNEIIGMSFPVKPPKDYRMPKAVLPKKATKSTSVLPEVPAFDWSYGCSATSAAMMMGYYDRHSYPDMYTGPTDEGLTPLTNSIWGHTTWPDFSPGGGTMICGECPLSATHKGKDGCVDRGHVDDYWTGYSYYGDPFIDSGWTAHTPDNCLADFMGTSRVFLDYSEEDNVDGSTMFFNYGTGAPLYDYTGYEPDMRDGCHGVKLFVASRGYTVLANYSQCIKGQGSDPNQGFTYAQYMQEIDAGRPVLIHVAGHTMLGFGYNQGTKDTVYLHDTWDYEDHTMIWGETYDGKQHFSVTVVQLNSAPSVPSTPKAKAASIVNYGGFNANWSASHTASNYKLDVSEDNFITFVADFHNYVCTDTFMAVNGLSPNTLYYYRVRAHNGGGDSDYSDTTQVTTLTTTAKFIEESKLQLLIQGDRLFIKNNDQKGIIILYDLQGRLMFTEQINGQKNSINISNLKGCYLVRVITGKESFVKKIIVQ